MLSLLLHSLKNNDATMAIIHIGSNVAIAVNRVLFCVLAICSGCGKLCLFIGHNLHSDAGYAMIFDVENQETASTKNKGFLFFREITFQR